MAASDFHLGPGQATGFTPPSPSLSSSERPSADDARLQDGVLSRNTVDNQAREPGDSAPDAPPRVQTAPAENPSQATNRRLASLTPKVINKAVDFDLHDLDYWPTILKWQFVTFLILLYAVTGTAIGLLMWKAIHNGNYAFRLSSENVHMISRFFPSIVGTVTVLFFRQTVREALRMEPFVSMADQFGEETAGSEPWIGVGGAWFPWQSITTTPNSIISFFSLVCQFVVSFIVSLKVALFASAQYVDNDTHEPYWILTVRLYPAVVLIAGYIMMIVYTLYISCHFYGKSTGLKWDPVSIADYAALFAHCNALQYFAPLELRHHLRPKHVMVPNRFFRLGYWTRQWENSTETDVVYGIGVGFSAYEDAGPTSRKERALMGHPWQHILTFRKRKLPPDPVDRCPWNRSRECAHGTWPDCEHYPYNYNPGCERWTIAFFSLLPVGALALSIYALVIRLPNKGFSFPNNLQVPFSNHTLSSLDPADPNGTVLLWALMFRSAPTYAAGLFTSTIITWIDLNMRFMQPFRNMFGKGPEKTFRQRSRDWLGWWRPKPASSEEKRTPATAAESILLAYITVSPLQVPLSAWEKGHFKVCIYSTLNTLSPLFPIFVGGLLVVTPNEANNRVNFQFSLSAYIGMMVSLVLYSILLPMSMPGAYRLLPRQLYSLADLMAMCHQSKFMASPDLDITHKKQTPSKQHMEARLLLSEDRFLFGVYRGLDKQGHIGFDVAWAKDPDSEDLKDLGDSVKHIPPEGFLARAQRTGTLMLEEGKRRAGRAVTMTGAMTGNMMNPFAQRAHIPSGEEQEHGIPLMSGGLGQPRAEASGSEAQQIGNGGRTRSARFDSPSPHA